MLLRVTDPDMVNILQAFFKDFLDLGDIPKGKVCIRELL
jgi:hypothetical protein